MNVGGGTRGAGLDWRWRRCPGRFDWGRLGRGSREPGRALVRDGLRPIRLQSLEPPMELPILSPSLKKSANPCTFPQTIQSYTGKAHRPTPYITTHDLLLASPRAVP